MSGLGDLRSRRLAGADGPDGLVGDDDPAPVLDEFGDSGKLPGVDLVGLTGFTLLKSLADA